MRVSLRVAALALVLSPTLVACQKSIFHDYRIPNVSMEPTFSKHERITMRTIERGARVQRGDIVVFRRPGQEHKKYLKRIVALAGDAVEIKDDTLRVNGVAQREPYAKYSHWTPPAGPIRVPPGSVFVLGDNRANSLDSRHFGCVPMDNIIGVVTR